MDAKKKCKKTVRLQDYQEWLEIWFPRAVNLGMEKKRNCVECMPHMMPHIDNSKW